jgi:L-serine/L-threonine ammonia-lyase
VKYSIDELAQLTLGAKTRAMGNLILSHISNPSYANRRVHFYISSSGNSGVTAVCVARSYSHMYTVVMPFSTPSPLVQKLRDAGATEVIDSEDYVTSF